MAIPEASELHSLSRNSVRERASSLRMALTISPQELEEITPSRFSTVERPRLCASWLLHKGNSIAVPGVSHLLQSTRAPSISTTRVGMSILREPFETFIFSLKLSINKA